VREEKHELLKSIEQVGLEGRGRSALALGRNLKRGAERCNEWGEKDQQARGTDSGGGQRPSIPLGSGASGANLF